MPSTAQVEVTRYALRSLDNLERVVGTMSRGDLLTALDVERRGVRRRRSVLAILIRHLWPKGHPKRARWEEWLKTLPRARSRPTAEQVEFEELWGRPFDPEAELEAELRRHNPFAAARERREALRAKREAREDAAAERERAKRAEASRRRRPEQCARAARVRWGRHRARERERALSELAEVRRRWAEEEGGC